MILTIENICQYLLDSKLIDLKSIIEGDLLIRDASSRNTNFLVNQFHENGLRVLVKQPDITDEDYVLSMEVEAQIYQIIYNDINFEQIRPYLPHFRLYDVQNHILIMEQLTGVCRVFDYLYQGQNLPDENIIQHFANALSAIHNIELAQISSLKFQKAYPWFLNIGKKTFRKSIKKNEPEVYQQLSDIFENQELMHLVSLTKKKWKMTNLIHLDVRFTNWMIPFRHQPNKDSPVWLIDWEMAGRGDAAWDVAFLLGDWINLGMYFQQYRSEIYPESKAEVAQQIKCFWKIYTEKRGLSEKIKKQFLKRVCNYLPIKILMNVYEMLSDEPEDTETPQDHIALFKSMIQNPNIVQQTYFND